MHNLLSHHPELGLIFLHQAARNTREENDFCLRIATGSVRMRLIHFLSKFSEANSSYSEEGLVINIPIYRKNIAAMIGVRPESLSRLIYQMENEGIAEFGNKWVRISNPHTFFAGYPFHSPGLGCYAGGMEDASHPVAGVDYPQTFQAMDERFRNDKACRDYIWRLRWPNGFVCRHCGAAVEPWTMARGRLRCRACRGETSLTSGTIFEGTRKPLRMWLMAMWFVTAQRNGVSALGLQRVLGLGSYETAWTWLHKLRRAMVRPGRDLLSGAVEVGKIYVGGPEEGDRGRETEHKAIVAVAAEKNGRGTGRIRLRRIGDVSVDSMFPFIRSAVMPGAVVHTDGWKGYAGLAEAGYQHQVAVINGGSDPAHEVMPRVHIVASLLKQWLIGPHQGGIQRQHLDYYLDEFTFRFNRRRSRSRGLLFHRLSQQAVAIEPAPYRAIINPVGSDGFPLAGE
jgi:transposase-like protein